jgi:hypothetical protein
MRSLRRLTLLPTLFACSLVASGCATRERLTPIFPPPADLQAVSEPKPRPPVEIVTSAMAAAEYDIDLELWGERVSAAGGRLCRWSVRNGAKLPFDCPAARTPDPAD